MASVPKNELYEKFLQRTNKSLLNFIIGKTLLQEKYHKLFNNEHNNSNTENIINIIIIIAIVIFGYIITIIHLIEDFDKSILITDTIIFGLQVIVVILSFIKAISKSTYFPFLASWFLFLTLFAQIIFYIVTYAKVKETILLHKVYYDIIGSHLIMAHMLKINMSMHIGHFIIIIILDVFVVISINLVTKCFYYEILSICLLNIYLFCNGFKIEYINMSLFAYYIKSKLKNQEYKEMILGALIGLTECTVNTNDYTMEIDHFNKVFERNMNCFIYTNTALALPSMAIAIDSNQNNNTMDTFSRNKNNNPNTSHNNLLLNSGPVQSLLFPKPIIPNVIRHLSADILYQKVNNSDKDDSKRFTKTLKDYIKEEMEVINQQKVYKSLGQFKCKLNNSLYGIYIKIRKSNPATAIVSIIIIELTNNRFECKQKVETVYQELIMSNISSQIREGIGSIINILATIKNQKNTDMVTMQKFASSSSIFSPNTFFNVNMETLQKINSLADCILIIIANLIECVKTKASNLIYDNNNNNNSYYHFTEFKLFLDEVITFYLGLYRKSFNIKYNIEEAFYNIKLLTNELKLKQIASNLISNAIKHTPSNTDLTITIDAEHDDDHDNESNQSIKNIGQNTIIMRFIIQDQGSGIPIILFKKINESYSNKKIEHVNTIKTTKSKERHNNLYTRCKGHKMGLVISKKLAKELGAQLLCEYIQKNNYTSAPIQGTKFILELPTEFKRITSPKKNTAKSHVGTNTQGSFHISQRFKNKVYKKSESGKNSINNIISLNANNHEESLASFDEFIANESPSDDHDETSIISQHAFNNEIVHLNTINNSSKFHSTNSIIHRISKSNESKRRFSKKRYTDTRSPFLMSQHRKELFSPILPKQNSTTFGLVSKAKSPFSLSRNKKMNINTPTYPNRKQDFLGHDLNIQDYHRHENHLSQFTKKSTKTLNRNNNYQTVTIIPAQSLTNKIMIIDESITYQTNLEMIIKTFFNKKEQACTIMKFEDGVDALYELNQELKNNQGRLKTKFIFCGEQMKFLNGSLMYSVLSKCSLKNAELAIPFVLCSSDAKQLKEKMKEIGLDMVYNKPLSRNDIESIFSMKIINSCLNEIYDCCN